MTRASNQTAIRLTETRYGRIKHFELDDPIGRSLEVYGEWAQAEIDFLAQIIRPGDVVADIGANIGTHTLAFANLVGPEGRVVAVEPQPAVFELLAENVRGNGLENVTLHAAAISDVAGTVPLAVPDYGHRHNSGVASLATQGGRTVQVECKRIDDLGLERCALLKMDIEGWEDKALASAKETLERCRPFVYAECNSIEAGWLLYIHAKDSFDCYLHAPHAFNPQNHRRTSENVFGIAQETNLLLVPREKAAEFAARLAKEPHLYRVDTLDDLARAFLRAARYGEPIATPERNVALARRLQQLEKELIELRTRAPIVTNTAPSAPKTELALTRPVHVIVPIYNGFDDFERLVDSIRYSYPKPSDKLTFVFINDASPDPRIAAFLQSDVFQRTDVIRLENPRNRGFIGTVNRGIELCAAGPKGTDIIILNTDTLIFGKVFEILQDVAIRLPNVASVTPLSNNATIASLLNWPHGGDLFGLMQPEEVARAVEAAQVRAPLVDAPTGVGFCMYMTKAALDAVGGFDPAYGKGYGEENNWCQHASKKGFVNLLTTESFVYHHGSVSFGDEVKQQSLAKNLKLLESSHPSYHRDVLDYTEADPLRAARTQVQWVVRRHYQQALGLHTVMYLLHADPSFYGGGTEKHVMALTERLLTGGRSEVFILYPDTATGQFVLKTYFPRAVTDKQNAELLVARYEPEELLELLRAIGPEVDTLHVHHFLDWPRWIAQALPFFKRAKKLLTLHDYYAICPSIRLLGRHGYCDVPSNLAQCNSCLAEVHNFKELKIEEWRTVNADFLQAFDEVYTPSEASRQVLSRGFGVVSSPSQGTLAATAAPKIRVAPNFIIELPDGPQPPFRTTASGPSPRVVFLGAYSEPKGASLFHAAAEKLQAKGLTLEIWGNLGRRPPENVAHRLYRTSKELRQLAQEFPADVVVLPATWPETFSFTTYEAVLDVRAPVVVGPYGNPPEVVRKFGVGAVLDSLTVDGFVAAVDQCLSNRAAMASKLEAFEVAAQHLTVENYFNRVYAYLSEHAAEPNAHPIAELPAPSNRRSRGSRGRLAVPEVPLRYRLVDQTNELIKTGIPGLHVYGRKLGEWMSRKRQG